jgi:RNA recognition motif-containing protein
MRLFVGNLSFQTTEVDLQDAFEKFGTVTDCKIMMDRATNRSRGFAFVTMGSAAEGEEAMKNLDGKQFDGRAIKVNEARPREEGGGGGGGGGFRGGGGGGGGGYRGGGERGERGGGERERSGGGGYGGGGGGGGGKRW